MTFSLIHFLDFNLLMLILFPWAKACIKKDIPTKNEFCSVFISGFIFLFIYFFIVNSEYIKQIIKPITFKQTFFAIIITLLCIGLDITIFFLKYKKLKIEKIQNENLFIVILLLIVIPIQEELIFRAFLYRLCNNYFDLSFPFILLSGVSFGLNHIIYSKINIFTKLLWGIAFAIEFLLFQNILLCVLSHILCNLCIYFLGKFHK